MAIFLMMGACVGLFKAGGGIAWEDSFHRLFHWADRFQEMAESNKLLRLENKKLQIDLENLKFQKNEDWAHKQTEKNKALLLAQAGSEEASTPPSMTYEHSLDLNSNHLFSLGIYYFNHREDEKAAMALTQASKHSEDARFHELKYQMMLGIAWYRVQNYVLAESYFDEVIKYNDSSYQTQAMVWKALSAKKQHRERKSQFWLNALLEKYPHALETSLVNLKSRK